MRKQSITILVVSLAAINTFAQSAMPSALVYKTRADYRSLVSIELSADKKTVTSYPDPADVKNADAVTPGKLHKGYLLDKRGVSANTAYIKMTNKEYGKLSAPPSAEDLYKMIVDKDPMTELYNCGPRSRIKTSELNRLIDDGRLKKKCKSLK